MAAGSEQVGQRQFDPGDASTSELIDSLNQYQGPPSEFLANLLAVQCRLAAAVGGAILRGGAENRIEVIAIFPVPDQGATAPVWLAQAVQSASSVISGGATSVKPLHGPDDLYGQPASRHLVMIPLKSAGSIGGAAAFMVKVSDETSLTNARESLELTVSLLSLYEMRLMLQRRQADLRRLRMATDVLASVNEQDRFAGSAMALCNEFATHWGCERVSLGFLKGRYVHLKATSHTEKFSRKMKLVQHIEAAMEECLDQDVEVVFPPPPEATFVSRSAEELSKHHGPTAVISLPLRKTGDPIAVLTVERQPEAPFGLEEAESLRLACDLCTARLEGLYEHDRWFGARTVAAARKGLSLLLGPKHTWVKLVVICVFAALAFLIFAKGDYRVDASFVLEATQRQVVPAPFDGYIKTVTAAPPDKVQGGKTVLGTLDTSELRFLLANAKVEQFGHLTRAVLARRDGKTAEAEIANADAEKIAAEIRLIEYRIGKAELVAPITGVVVVGELERRVGYPVKTGDVLFEVAPLESLRAELFVPEDQIADVIEGQSGELTAVSYPNQRIGFVVEHINPVAEVADQQNVFRVRVILKERRPWMRPGMEGVAKISVEDRSYVHIWSRRLVNWVRMKFWF